MTRASDPRQEETMTVQRALEVLDELVERTGCVVFKCRDCSNDGPRFCPVVDMLETLKAPSRGVGREAVMGESVQMLAVDDIEFLEAHDATVWFSQGKKVGIEWRRPDGLLLQHSGWSIGEAINHARRACREWETR